MKVVRLGYKKKKKKKKPRVSFQMARRRVSGIPDICNSNMKEVDASAHSRIRCFIMRQHITLLPPLSFLSSFFSFLSFFFFCRPFTSPGPSTLLFGRILRVGLSVESGAP